MVIGKKNNRFALIASVASGILVNSGHLLVTLRRGH